LLGASVVGRAAAVAAVAVALVGVVVLLLGSARRPFTIKANFINASQLVRGDLVEVSGDSVGSVSDIELTHDGQAQLTLKIDKSYAPLRHGTELTVRQTSLSGIANRYVELRLGSANAPVYHEGEVIPATQTVTAVDLDQLFNVFGPRERRALQDVIQGSALQYAGKGEKARAGFAYLNPALATSSTLFRELNRDTNQFTRFLVSSAGLVSDIAQRRDDLAGLVSHLSTTTAAIARPTNALGDAVQLLPPFMRRANTTFVNLRSTLDTLKPLVAESKPVARKLRPFLAQLRPLARDAQPTIRDLSRLTSSPGASNDLIELTAGTVPLAKATVGKVFANGKLREGAFPASARALETGTPELAYARPYAVDLTGWFDDFSHPGVQDALGGASRVQGTFNSLLLQNGQAGTVIQPLDRAPIFQMLARNHQYQRCPGSEERDPGDGSTPYHPPGYPCDPTQVPPGP